MSTKPVAYTSLPEMSYTVLAILRENGPLKPKQIADTFRPLNGGHRPKVSAINRVLVEHLVGEVVRASGGRWSAASEADSATQP